MKTIVAEDFGVVAGTKVHKFELAGMGKAPYRYTGMTKSVYQACPDAPVQPGSTCDYCGTGIMYVFGLLSSDGKRSKVGCDCIFKSDDSGLRKAIARDKAKHDREVRQARATKKLAEARALFGQDVVKAVLASKPHPFTSQAARGLTLSDYVDFLLRNGGTSGQARALKLCKTAAQ
jgi:hypothetical protein